MFLLMQYSCYKYFNDVKLRIKVHSQKVCQGLSHNCIVIEYHNKICHFLKIYPGVDFLKMTYFVMMLDNNIIIVQTPATFLKMDPDTEFYSIGILLT